MDRFVIQCEILRIGSQTPLSENEIYLSDFDAGSPQVSTSVENLITSTDICHSDLIGFQHNPQRMNKSDAPFPIRHTIIETVTGWDSEFSWQFINDATLRSATVSYWWVCFTRKRHSIFSGEILTIISALILFPILLHHVLWSTHRNTYTVVDFFLPRRYSDTISPWNETWSTILLFADSSLSHSPHRVYRPNLLTWPRFWPVS